MKKNNKPDDNSPSLEDKIRLVERLIVIHPQMQAVLDKIEYCREHAKHALEPVGLLITGEKGAGKTTIKNVYVEKHCIKRTKTATVMTVVQITIPVPATVSGLNICLLTVLGDPFSNYGSITAQTLRAYNLVQKCRVELVMFDEFQHFA
jgi:hypothetical protein